MVSLHFNSSFVAGLVLVLAVGRAAIAEPEFTIERNYAAQSEMLPSEIPELGYVSSHTGTATLKNGRLLTTDDDATGDGRFFAIPAGAFQIDDETDLSLTFRVQVSLSTGSRSATAVEFVLPSEMKTLGEFHTGVHGEGYQDVLTAGRMICIGLVSDGRNHARDEVLLVDPYRNADEGILARATLPLDQSRSFELRVQRLNSGPDDDRITLTADDSQEIFSFDLNQFQAASRTSPYTLLFGHPAADGLASATWSNVNLRIRNRTNDIPGTREPSTPVTLSQRHQLFVDDFLIDNRSNLQREQGQPVKRVTNPVLKREMPWEAARCELYGSAIWNPSRKRVELYYSATKQPYDAKLAVAYSNDEGQTWTRPAFNVFPWDGQPSNIVWPGRYWAHGPCVLLDSHETDPQKQYKLFLTAAPVDPTKENEIVGRKGIDVAFSPDGVHWTPAPENPVIPGFNSDTGNCVIWDTKKQIYRAYVRIRCNVGRSVAITESPDFIHWSEPKTIYFPTPFDAARSWEFYGLSVTQVGDQYVGLVWIFPNTPESSSTQSHSAVTWPELVVSRDGEQWERPFPGCAFLPPGKAGEFDHRQIRPASSFTILPDRVLLLYSGSPHAHVSFHHWDIGLAELRPDGFACLRADDRPGELLTRPLWLEGKTLHLNASVKEGGEIRTELIDDTGRPIDGYRLDDCLPIRGDNIDAVVRWKDHASLPAPGAQPVRLRLQLRHARLYSLHLQP